MIDARRIIAVAVGSLFIGGCAFSTSTESSSGDTETEVEGLSQTRNDLADAPDGFSIEADGEVWILTNLEADPGGEVLDSTDGVQLGSAMVTSRGAEILDIAELDEDTISITFACISNSEDYVDRLEYSFDGTTLKLDSYISGTGGTSAEPCASDEGVSVEVPLQSAWNPSAEVEQVAVR